MASNKDDLGQDVAANREALNYRDYYGDIAAQLDQDAAAVGRRRNHGYSRLQPNHKDELTARRFNQRFLWVRLGFGEHPDLAVHQPWIDKIRDLDATGYDAIYLQLSPAPEHYEPYELLYKPISVNPYDNTTEFPIQLVIGNPFDQLETETKTFPNTNYVGGRWKLPSSGILINEGPYSEEQVIEAAATLNSVTIDFAELNRLESSGVVVTTTEQRQYVDFFSGALLRQENVYLTRYPLHTQFDFVDYRYRTTSSDERTRSFSLAEYEPQSDKSIYAPLAQTLQSTTVPGLTFGVYDLSGEQTLYSVIEGYAKAPLNSYDLIVIETPTLYRDHVLAKGSGDDFDYPGSELKRKAALNLIPQVARLGQRLTRDGYLTKGEPTPFPGVPFPPSSYARFSDRAFNWIPQGQANNVEDINILRAYSKANMVQYWAQPLSAADSVVVRQLQRPLDAEAYAPHTRSVNPPLLDAFQVYYDPGQLALLSVLPLQPQITPYYVFDAEQPPLLDLRSAKDERWRDILANPLQGLYQYLDVLAALSNL